MLLFLSIQNSYRDREEILCLNKLYGFCGDYLHQLLLRGRCVAQRSLCRCQASNGDTIGRAANVVKSNAIAEFNALGIATMFSTDTEFELGIGFAATFYSNTNQLANAITIERLERIDRQNFDFPFQT